MKKRLEAELISIAHRILKLKNKSEVDQLYKETQKLYETLTVLKFYQDNFEAVKEEISENVLEEKLEQPAVVELSPEPISKSEEDVVEAVADAEPEVEVTPEAEEVAEPEEEQEPEVQPEIEEKEEEVTETKEELAQPEAEAEVAVALAEETIEEEPAPEIEEKPSFEPIFELEVEEEEQEIAPAEIAFESQPEEKLEDHIGKYADPIFEKVNDVSLFPSESKEAETVKEEEPKKEEFKPAPSTSSEIHSKSIAIGLNDRIGFVQHLFNDSNEDFNRVISQLNTFDTFEEAKNFINEMVIPDYGYWVGQEDYMERFMAIVEKKFE